MRVIDDASEPGIDLRAIPAISASTSLRAHPPRTARASAWCKAVRSGGVTDRVDSQTATVGTPSPNSPAAKQ
jgi:hypothetical protein